MEFNFDLDVTPKPVFDPNATMFATVPGNVADLGNGECIFRPQHEDVPHVMTHQVLRALDRCREFRSADEHIEAIRKDTPNVPTDGIRRVFNGLVSRGLITSAEDFAAGFTELPIPTPAPSGGLFVRACDRPAQLETLLESLRQHQAKGGVAHPLTVVDDSRSGEARSAQARLLQAHRERVGGGVRHVDADAWQRAHQALNEALPEHRAAIDGLIGRTRDGKPRTGPGRGWNLALLLGAGQRILFGDDDFVLPLKLHPQLRDGIEIQAHEMTTVRFYTDTASAMNSGLDADFDLLQWHLDLCGAPIGKVFDHAGHLLPTREQWRRIAPSRLTNFVPQARIAATMNGHRGHSGSVTSDWMFLLDPTSSHDLNHDRARYLRLIESGKVWVGPDRAASMVSTPFTPFAQDLSQLPPFVAPDERGEDGTFGALTRIMDPQAWILHLPTSVGHLRDVERPFMAPGKHAAMKNFNYFLVDFLGRFEDDLFAGMPETRLQSAAARLEDLANAGEQALLRMLGDYVTASYSAQIARLQAIAAEAGNQAPVYWTTDLQAVIKVNAQAMLYDGPPRLGHWPVGLTVAETAARLRRELNDYAGYMCAWPTIWRTARELVASGRLG